MTRLKREHVEDAAAVVIVLMVAALMWWLSGNVRQFFAWPNGETWPNLVSWLEGSVTTAMVIWLARDHLGTKLAVWFHKHHMPHLQEQLANQHVKIEATITNHLGAVSNEIAEVHAAVK